MYININQTKDKSLSWKPLVINNIVFEVCDETCKKEKKIFPFEFLNYFNYTILIITIIWNTILTRNEKNDL